MTIIFLQSKKLAIGLLIAFLCFLLLSIIVPQESSYTPAEFHAVEKSHPVFARFLSVLSLDNIFSSYLFVGIAAALSINLFVCTGRRAIRLFMPGYFDVDDGRDDGGEDSKSAPPCPRSRNRSIVITQLAGSILFHVSILVIVGGFAASALFRFSGNVVLTEGQTFADRHEDYSGLSEGALFLENHGFFKATLQSVEHKFRAGRVSDVSCRVLFESDLENAHEDVKINYPAYFRGASFVLMSFGPAPLFRLADRDGKTVFHSYVNIQSGGCSSDYFDVPGENLRIYTRWARPLSAKNEPEEIGFSIKDPILVQVYRKNLGRPMRGKRIFKGVLRSGESITFNGYTIGFDGARRWARFFVTRDPGQLFVFFGFWMGTAGLCVRFLAESLLAKCRVAFHGGPPAEDRLL